MAASRRMVSKDQTVRNQGREYKINPALTIGFPSALVNRQVFIRRVRGHIDPMGVAPRIMLYDDERCERFLAAADLIGSR